MMILRKAAASRFAHEMQTCRYDMALQVAGQGKLVFVDGQLVAVVNVLVVPFVERQVQYHNLRTIDSSLYLFHC